MMGEGLLLLVTEVWELLDCFDSCNCDNCCWGIEEEGLWPKAGLDTEREKEKKKEYEEVMNIFKHKTALNPQLFSTTMTI